MARASREEAERTGRRILEQARAAFAKEGYADVRLEEVAAAAGVTRGAVYHRYRSKQALFADVLASVMGEVAAAVVKAAEQVAPGSGAWAPIKAGCLAFVAAATAPGVRRILVVDGPAVVGWEAWRELDAQHSRRMLAEGLGELAAEGLLRGDPESATILLSGALNEGALWVAAHPDPDRALDALDDTLDSLLQGLGRNVGGQPGSAQGRSRHPDH
ncbi:TetR/AcrR family transcriptional regulator [Granulicoccus sp. GXG6511]|uniref:TetR/AcrR family transcriptional regulator n=1 Tax=Granulicoccus sp. GXG6511 TaxID=3381351 RepID=UPI003D7F035A